MLKKIFLITVLFFSIGGSAQKLVYTSNGNVTDKNRQKIAPDKVREILSGNEKLLSDYNAGRSKKTVGNVLMIGGLGLLATDVLVEMFSPADFDEDYNVKKKYPTALTYIGAAAFIISIPVKIGFSKKIKNAVDEHNKNVTTTGFIQKTEFISNKNGLGFRLTLH